MNQINGLPSEPYDFGHGFNYEAWTPGSKVTLCRVPWDSTYRDIVDFKTKDALNSYLLNSSMSPLTIDRMTYLRMGAPVRVDLPFNAAYTFNYLKVENPGLPVPGDTNNVTAFYYFIMDVRYVAPNTTELVLQLDVWQTFKWTLTARRAYVERGHIGIAQQNNDADYGRAYLTQPEGLDIGGEYQVEFVGTRTISDTGLGSNNYGVMVYSSTRIANGTDFMDPGTLDDPKLRTSVGSLYEGLPNGMEMIFFPSITDFYRFTVWVSDYPWISQGIASVMLIPTDLMVANNVYEGFDGPITSSRAAGVKYYIPKFSYVKQAVEDHKLATGFRKYIMDNVVGNRYKNLKKFTTSPYMMLELTAYTGTPIVIKPESIASNDFVVRQLTHMALPSPRVMFYPLGMNKTSRIAPGREGTPLARDDGGEFMDVMTGFFNFPQFSIANNSYLNYIASNAHTIAYSHQNAEWTQQKALTANQMGYDQSTSAIGMTNAVNQFGNANMAAQTQLSNQANWAHTGVNAAGGIVGGAMRGGQYGAIGGAMGAAQGAANTAVSNSANTQSTAMNVHTRNAVTAAQTANMGYVRDTNKAYADFAAKGDYANSIAAVQAKVQDAKLLQPSTSGQVGGDAFMMAATGLGVVVKVKTISAAARNAVGDFWLRYGYAINRWVNLPDDLCVMKNFTYWKVSEMYLTSNWCPEQYRQTIRGIFEKGVTVWRDPAKIAGVDLADNDPVPGLYY